MLHDRITHLKAYLRSRYTDSGNQSVIVIGALLLAITLWLLVTLNQNYETSIVYPVTIERIPDNIQMGELAPLRVSLRVKGPGVDLLEEHMRFKRDTLRFAYSNQFRSGYMLTNSAMREIVGALPAGLSPVRVQPDSLFFAIDDKIPKKVPLIHRVNIRLKPAFQLEREPALEPDSVIVRGPKAMLDTLQVWYTESMNTEVLGERETVRVPIIDTFPQFSVYPKEATLEVDPRKYTQLQLSLPIKVVEVPPGITVRLDKEVVKVNCLVPMDEYETLKGASYQILLRYPDIDQDVPYFLPNTDFLEEPIKVVSRIPAFIPYVIVTLTDETP